MSTVVFILKSNPGLFSDSRMAFAECTHLQIRSLCLAALTEVERMRHKGLWECGGHAGGGVCDILKDKYHSQKSYAWGVFGKNCRY